MRNPEDSVSWLPGTVARDCVNVLLRDGGGTGFAFYWKRLTIKRSDAAAYCPDEQARERPEMKIQHHERDNNPDGRYVVAGASCERAPEGLGSVVTTRCISSRTLIRPLTSPSGKSRREFDRSRSDAKRSSRPA